MSNTRRRCISYGGRPKLQFRTSATYSSGSVGSGATIVIPSATQEGDLVVIWDYAVGTNAHAPVVRKLGDFNTAVSDTFNKLDTGAAAIFSYKFATATDANRSYEGSSASGGVGTAIVLVFKAVGGSFTSYASGDPSIDLGVGGTAPAQTVSGSNPPTVIFGLWNLGSASTFGFSPSQDATISSGDLKVAYKIFDENDAAANVTLTVGSSSTLNCMAGCFINQSI